VDSITQITLGCAIGEVCLGRQLGNRAILWGGLVGTLADLDVLANPFLDEVTKLTWHRGYSHSILIVLVAAPLLAWLMHRLYRDRTQFKQWLVFMVVALQASIWLDAFTVYGTQLLQPFSDFPVGFNSISIVDPLFTLPLLLAVVTALFLRRENGKRRRLNGIALAFCGIYLLATLGFKAHVNAVAKDAFAKQGIAVTRTMTSPTIFNTVLWRIMGEVADGYWVGYHSLLDQHDGITFAFVPRNESLLAAVRGSRAHEVLMWFSQGWYTVHRLDGRLMLSDIRFGELDVDLNNPRVYIFTWELLPEPSRPGEYTFVQVQPEMNNFGALLRNLIEGIMGRLH
jgi:inner membrane protein